MSKIEVIKPSWVIHISHTLSLVQQQLWNVLLAFASNNLAKQAIHTINVRILQHYLGNKRSIIICKTCLMPCVPLKVSMSSIRLSKFMLATNSDSSHLPILKMVSADIHSAMSDSALSESTIICKNKSAHAKKI